MNSVDSEDEGFEMLTDVIPFLLLLSINNVIVMFFSVLTYANNSTNASMSSMHFDNYSVHCELWCKQQWTKIIRMTSITPRHIVDAIALPLTECINRTSI
ncbi:hypothetical protein KSF78_0004606 [Schistosoma japonicum]|nr:hypothetical protein KSF78_0004606 [Schistosoma japonicum]